MELLAAVILFAVIVFFILDDYLFSKFRFSLRDTLGMDWYFNPSARYRRAMMLFYEFPTQNKVDVLIKYGLFDEGAKLIPIVLNADSNTVVISNGSSNHAVLNIKSNTLTLIPDVDEKGFIEYQLISQETGAEQIVRRFTWANSWGFDYYWWKHFDEIVKSHSDGARMCRELIRLHKN